MKSEFILVFKYFKRGIKSILKLSHTLSVVFQTIIDRNYHKFQIHLECLCRQTPT